MNLISEAADGAVEKADDLEGYFTNLAVDEEDTALGSFGGLWDNIHHWWFYAEGTWTTIEMRQSSRARENVIINNAFVEHPGFVVS